MRMNGEGFILRRGDTNKLKYKVGFLTATSEGKLRVDTGGEFIPHGIDISLAIDITLDNATKLPQLVPAIHWERDGECYCMSVYQNGTNGSIKLDKRDVTLGYVLMSSGTYDASFTPGLSGIDNEPIVYFSPDPDAYRYVIWGE